MSEMHSTQNTPCPLDLFKSRAPGAANLNFSMERSRSVSSFPKGAPGRTLCCRLAVGRFLTIPISSFRTDAGKVVLSHPPKSRPVVFASLKRVQC